MLTEKTPKSSSYKILKKISVTNQKNNSHFFTRICSQLIFLENSEKLLLVFFENGHFKNVQF